MSFKPNDVIYLDEGEGQLAVVIAAEYDYYILGTENYVDKFRADLIDAACVKIGTYC